MSSIAENRENIYVEYMEYERVDIAKEGLTKPRFCAILVCLLLRVAKHPFPFARRGRYYTSSR